MFFDSWYDLGRVVVTGVVAYAALIFFLRISGKRTLSKMNAFDLVITVAFGSTLASIILSKSVALAEGILALALLVALQYVVTWTSIRSKGFQNLIKAEPSVLFYRGEMLPKALQQQRVTPAEVRAAIRGAGLSLLEEVEAVFLETDGSLSVLPRSDRPATAALSDADNYPPRGNT